MQRLTPLMIFVLGLLCGCAHANRSDQEGCYETVSLPHLTLAKGERIESVEMTIAGARFMAINRIPIDWRMEVEFPDAGVSDLHGEAGHGVGWLSSSHELDDFVTIFVYDCEGLTIHGKVFIASPDSERSMSFQGADYPMKRLP